MLMHFKRLLEFCEIQGWDENHQTLTINRDKFKQLIKVVLAEFPFDEEWYLEHNPDVREAIKKKLISSPREHYFEFGYFEGRLPGLNGFNADEYIATYEDLSRFVGLPNAREAAAQHYVLHGYNEGRKPKMKRAVDEGNTRIAVDRSEKRR